MVLVESVTVGLVRAADNGSFGTLVVVGFCGQELISAAVPHDFSKVKPICIWANVLG